MIVDPPTAEVPAPDELGRVHFLGIGGEGMARVAQLMLERGVPTSGCDTGAPASVGELRALGAEIAQGNDPAHLDTADALVTSSAVRPTNPELSAATDRGTLVLHRAAALASLMRGRRGVAVTGTHGKTTTSGMLTVALQGCGLDPSFALGAELAGPGTAAHDGHGEVFVAEADESDASFLWYSPEVSVVTNIDADHLENFGTREAYAAAFDGFVRRVRPGGHLVTCLDDPGSAALVDVARRSGTSVLTYGTDPGADLRVEELDLRGVRSAFRLVCDGTVVAEVSLQVPGAYNALNAAAAFAAGMLLGADPDSLRAGLAGFTGTRRRFEAKGSAGTVRVFDDYAHHPVELAAVLRAARGVAGGGRVVAVFEPKRYTRTQMFADDFGAALGLADVAVVTDVYGHLEDPIPGVDGALVASAVPLAREAVHHVPRLSAVPGVVAALARPGDLILTIGGGDEVATLGPAILELLAREGAA